MSLYQAAAAMSAHARWQETISENLAAANIPGFKRQDLSFSAIEAGVMSQANPDPQVQFALPQASRGTNFSQGELRPTGAPTDVAIEGRGFFSVQLPNGATAYTRDGEFHINSSGQLTNKQGFLILGEAGPIQLDTNSGGQMTIAPNGEISQNGITRGKLRVVDFPQPEVLTQQRGGLFTVEDPMIQPIDAPQTTIRQGFLEGSNVASVLEMANLIGVMRGFEANQRTMQIHNDRMARTISELGNPN